MGWSLIIIRDNRAQCFKTQIPWTIKWLRRVRQYKAGKRTRAKERSGNFCGRFPYWQGGFMVCGFYVQEHPKAQPAVVLVLNCLRRQGHGLKSPQTDWEKPGIEPTTPGLRDIHLFVAFLGINQFRRVDLTYVLVLRREHLEMKVTTLVSYRSAILIGDPLTYRHHF